jgi:uncharacterized protein (TIGR00255 family)
MDTLAKYSEFLIREEPEYDVDSLYAAFREAAVNLEGMRSHEGKLLSDELFDRVNSLNKMNEEIKLLASQEITKWREKFVERLKTMITSENIDENRVLQEAAIMTDKIDISEEINRTENHLKQFVKILGDGNIIGKKLDFLLQEIGREVNTLACKSIDYSISHIAVEMKTEIEKMREQVQNIQ